MFRPERLRIASEIINKSYLLAGSWPFLEKLLLAIVAQAVVEDDEEDDQGAHPGAVQI